MHNKIPKEMTNMYLRFVNSTGINNIKIKNIFKKVTPYINLTSDRKPDVDLGLNISVVSCIIQTM
jgi:hypothetical protein